MKRGNNYSGARWTFGPKPTPETTAQTSRSMTMFGRCPHGGAHVFYSDTDACKKCGVCQKDAQ